MCRLNRFRRELDRLRARYGDTRVNLIIALVLIGIGSLVVRLLLYSRLGSSALLYVGVPLLGALALVIVRPHVRGRSWWSRYFRFELDSLIVILGSSIVLLEGFICIAYFLPIYFLVSSMAFLVGWLFEKAQSQGGKMSVSIIPLLIFASSFEGTTEALSFERTTHVTAVRVADLSPDQVLRNLVRPINLNTKDRNWLLTIFPMPYLEDGESLNPGDIHIMRSRYHRWFVTNTHEGKFELEIIEVSPRKIRTRVVHDSTYFSSYLTQIGTEITLAPLSSNKTEITLRIDYTRELDPAWYFHPMQKYAMTQMAGFFIEQVMIRE